MAKLAAKKKPTKPDAPKKPSTRSKTGNAECSQAASNWQLSLRGKATLDPGTYQTLAKCRAMNRTGKMADAQGRTGKLSDQGAAALKGRLQKRFDSGLITQKARNERLNMLLKQRSERGKVETAKTAVTEGEKQPLKYTPKTKIDTPAQGELYSAKKALDDTNRRIKLEIRQNPRWNDGSMGRPSDLVLKELQLSSQANEARARIRNAESAIEKRANELGLTTKKPPKPAPPQPTPPPASVPKAAQPARYSLGGKLAPGRGTDLRKKKAESLLDERAKAEAEKILGGISKGRFANYSSSGIKNIEQIASTSGPRVREKLLMAAKDARDERTGEARYWLNKRDLRAIDWNDREKAVAIAEKVSYPKELPGQSKINFDAPTPAPARYSLGGKLAPGRGTEERKPRLSRRQIMAMEYGSSEQRAAADAYVKRTMRTFKIRQEQDRYVPSSAWRSALNNDAIYMAHQRNAARIDYNAQAKRGGQERKSQLLNAKLGRQELQRFRKQRLSPIVSQPEQQLQKPSVQPAKQQETQKPPAVEKPVQPQSAPKQAAPVRVPSVGKRQKGGKLEYVPMTYPGRNKQEFKALVSMHTENVGIVRADDTKKRSGYTIIDAKTGAGVGSFKVNTINEAKRIAKALDYLARRAPRKPGGEVSLASALNDDRYRGIAKSIIMKRMIR